MNSVFRVFGVCVCDERDIITIMFLHNPLAPIMPSPPLFHGTSSPPRDEGSPRAWDVSVAQGAMGGWRVCKEEMGFTGAEDASLERKLG